MDAELGGFCARKGDSETGYGTFMKGSVVLASIKGFLKRLHALRDYGLIKLGDPLWTKLFGELHQWQRAPGAVERGVV